MKQYRQWVAMAAGESLPTLSAADQVRIIMPDPTNRNTNRNCIYINSSEIIKAVDYPSSSSINFYTCDS